MTRSARSVSRAVPAAPAALGVLALLAGCAPQGGPAAAVVRTPLQPTATIQDLMDAEIDPAADYLWESVGTVVSAAGTEERAPRTDQEWAEVRRRAVTLVEAANLLLVPGRRVAAKEFPPEGPGALGSAEIEARLQRDGALFGHLAVALRQVSLQMLQAADSHDAKALASAGEALDGVCEACHVAHWYPRQVIPRLPDVPPRI